MPDNSPVNPIAAGPDVGSLVAGGIAGLAQALPIVIQALTQVGQPQLAKEVEAILGPQAKVIAELAAQEAATRADLAPAPGVRAADAAAAALPAAPSQPPSAAAALSIEELRAEWVRRGGVL